MLRKIRESGSRIAPGGMHHFRTGGGSHRMHLRVEADGRGLLIADASRIIHLNPVACDLAWMILSDMPEKKILEKIRSRYIVGRKRASGDLREFNTAFRNILDTGMADPVSYMNLDMMDPFQADVSVPYRMDLALTYRCNIGCAHCYNITREKKELTTDQWKEVIRKIWDLGIPHAIFTGGEATLRNDLVELTGFAESLGLVTGLLTNGVKLAEREYVAELSNAGLDHVQITLESSDPRIHNRMTGADSFENTVSGIRNCVEHGIHTITNTTITKDNAAGMSETLSFVHDLGLDIFAANTVIHSGKALEQDFTVPLEQLEGVMLDLGEKADELGMRIIWYSPTRYCRFNPLEFDLGPKRCTAGEYNLCIEPDGEVLPCQSWYESAGNILTDSWESIWNSALMKSSRGREWVEPECRNCANFNLCGGGCPLERTAGIACRDSM